MEIGRCPRRCRGEKFCEWSVWGEWLCRRKSFTHQPKNRTIYCIYIQFCAVFLTVLTNKSTSGSFNRLIMLARPLRWSDCTVTCGKGGKRRRRQGLTASHSYCYHSSKTVRPSRTAVNAILPKSRSHGKVAQLVTQTLLETEVDAWS